MSEKELIAIAKEEERQWNLPNGLVKAVLWAFIYRVTRGRTIEDDTSDARRFVEGGE